MDRMEKYLRPTPRIDCDNRSIREKSQDSTEGQEKVIDKAKSLFYFVRDQIKYNPLPVHLLEDYRASKTLETGKGFCVEKASLLVALARAAGIPARLHLADIRNHIMPDKLKELMGTNLFSYHGYCGLYIEGKWVKATPAFDLKMCQENRISPVEFDGKNDAIFHSHNLDGKLHIEYVKDHGYYEDVPMDEILAAWAKVYKMESSEQFYHFINSEKARQKVLEG
ncbi:MAG: transglutaminase domain-containing protein [Dehalococcoidia bacterium]|nr:transglutaminase domain-containing protein [Dehalococcoidia bacterium]